MFQYSLKHADSSFRRKPESSVLMILFINILDTGFRRCDELFFNPLLTGP